MRRNRNGRNLHNDQVRGANLYRFGGVVAAQRRAAPLGGPAFPDMTSCSPGAPTLPYPRSQGIIFLSNPVPL